MTGNEMTGGEAIARMIQAHRRRADVRHGRVSAAAVLRRGAPARSSASPDQRRARRRVRRPTPTPRSRGRVGLVDATLGPGATNLVTGLVEALNAGTPLVAFIGDAHRDHAGQEHDAGVPGRPTSCARPCKELLRVEYVSRIPELMRRAFLVATSGRPGPGGGRGAGGRVPRHAALRRGSVHRRCRATRPHPPCAAARRRLDSRAPRGCWPRRKPADRAVRRRGAHLAGGGGRRRVCTRAQTCRSPTP